MEQDQVWGQQTELHLISVPLVYLVGGRVQHSTEEMGLQVLLVVEGGQTMLVYNTVDQILVERGFPVEMAQPEPRGEEEEAVEHRNREGLEQHLLGGVEEMEPHQA